MVFLADPARIRSGSGKFPDPAGISGNLLEINRYIRKGFKKDVLAWK
jgi:hypothetical protein